MELIDNINRLLVKLHREPGNPLSMRRLRVRR
jgi:hypothetical protein